MYSAPGASSSVIGRCSSAPAASLGRTHLDPAQLPAEVVRPLAPDRHPGPAGRRLHRRTRLGTARRDQARRRPAQHRPRSSAPLASSAAAPPPGAARLRRPRPQPATASDSGPPPHLRCCTTIACQPPAGSSRAGLPVVPLNDGWGALSRGDPARGRLLAPGYRCRRGAAGQQRPAPSITRRPSSKAASAWPAAPAAGAARPAARAARPARTRRPTQLLRPNQPPRTRSQTTCRPRSAKRAAAQPAARRRDPCHGDG